MWSAVMTPSLIGKADFSGRLYPLRERLFVTLGTPSTVGDVRISYRVDHAVRVMTRLAEVAEGEATRPVSGAQLAELDGLPPSSVDDILRLLRNGGLVRSQRGGQGGWLLARPADTITVAQVIRAVDGPLAVVRGVRPHDLPADGEREPFVSLWIAVRASLRSVLEAVTIAHLASGELPKRVATLAAQPGSWEAHGTT
jgi:Rrf2 family protein